MKRVRSEKQHHFVQKSDKSRTGTCLWQLVSCGEGEQALNFDANRERNLNTYREWYHRETFNEFRGQPTSKRAAKFFQRRLRTAPRSQLAPIKKTALPLQHNLSGMLNYLEHPITKAISKGLYSKTQVPTADTRGFRRFDH